MITDRMVVVIDKISLSISVSVSFLFRFFKVNNISCSNFFQFTFFLAVGGLDVIEESQIVIIIEL